MNLFTVHAELLPGIIALCSFLAAVLLVSGVYQYVNLKLRKRQIAGRISPAEKHAPSGRKPYPAKAKKALLKPAGKLLARMGKFKDQEASPEYTKLRLKFQQAGWRSLHTFATFWGAKIFFALLLALAFGFSRLSIDLPINRLASLGLLLLFFLIGFNLPDLWLSLNIRRRKDRIFKSFPDALDLMVICMESGMGLDAAMYRVGLEMELSHSELSEELKIVNLEIRTGKPRRQALRNLALRTNLEDVRNLVTLLIQADKFGTSVGKALRVYSDSFRTKRQQRAEEKAGKLPVKIIFTAMVFIFPVLYVVTLGPPILSAIKAASNAGH